MAKRTRVTKKVDLRSAYVMGGYTGEYAWFVRTKVVPIIGEAALHHKDSLRGSQVKEYFVTQRNLHRVIKTLSIDNPRYKKITDVRKALCKIGPDVTADIIMSLVESVHQPSASTEYPLAFRIPLHPISHNMLYDAKGGRFVRSNKYAEWRKQFFPLIRSIVDLSSINVDLDKHTEISIKFGHREFSDRGHRFDVQNFTKAAIDCCYEYLGALDDKIDDIRTSREYVQEYSQGYMEFRIRNV